MAPASLAGRTSTLIVPGGAPSGAGPSLARSWSNGKSPGGWPVPPWAMGPAGEPAGGGLGIDDRRERGLAVVECRRA